MKTVVIFLIIIALAIPASVLIFAPNSTQPEELPDNEIPGECVITGCSGQICADEEVVTTCEYRSEYECFKSTVCERQKGGGCGWTVTPELTACLLGIDKEVLE